MASNASNLVLQGKEVGPYCPIADPVKDDIGYFCAYGALEAIGKKPQAERVSEFERDAAGMSPRLWPRTFTYDDDCGNHAEITEWRFCECHPTPEFDSVVIVRSYVAKKCTDDVKSFAEKLASMDADSAAKTLQSVCGALGGRPSETKLLNARRYGTTINDSFVCRDYVCTWKVEVRSMEQLAIPAPGWAPSLPEGSAGAALHDELLAWSQAHAAAFAAKNSWLPDDVTVAALRWLLLDGMCEALASAQKFKRPAFAPRKQPWDDENWLLDKKQEAAVLKARRLIAEGQHVFAPFGGMDERRKERILRYGEVAVTRAEMRGAASRAADAYGGRGGFGFGGAGW